MILKRELQIRPEIMRHPMNSMKKTALGKWFLGVAALAGMGLVARADMCFPDTNFFPILPPHTVNGSYVWDSTYQAIQATPTTGGWTLGTTNGVEFNFNWPIQTNVQAIANNGCGRVSFDVSVHNSSFSVSNWTNGSWYQIHYAGNSDSGGWVQDAGGFVTGFYATNSSNDQTWHFDLSFAQMGWVPGCTWFQLFWGGNSDSDKPLWFYVDDICIHCVPGDIVLQNAGDQVVLSWTNALFSLQSAPLITGPYTNIPGSTSPYTNEMTGSQQFFRLIY
jgi:hypothetical protein